MNICFDGGGRIDPPTIFICENNKKSNKIMHCVDIFSFLSGSFKDMEDFLRIYLFICYGSTKMYWNVLNCTEMYWNVLKCTKMY